jgi:hypothetical protein
MMELIFLWLFHQQQPGVVAREGIVEFVDMDAPQNDSLFLGL